MAYGILPPFELPKLEACRYQATDGDLRRTKRGEISVEQYDSALISVKPGTSVSLKVKAADA